MRVGIDYRELESFVRYYQKFWKKVPAIKTKALAVMGKVMQEEVRDQIREQGVQDRFGRVNRWQQLTLGDRGGYAKISPMAEHTDSTWKGKPVNSRQITIWLERGHGTRRDKYGYRSGEGYVKGRLFYSWAKLRGFRKALDAAEREIDRITDDWEWDDETGEITSMGGGWNL